MPDASSVPVPPVLDLDQVRTVTAFLAAVADDRGLLAGLPEPEKKALLAAAGRIAMPERDDAIRLRKAQRKHELREKQALKEQDKATRAEVGIRALRREAVFSAPLAALPAPAQPQAEVRELKTPRHCYICKQDFTRLHHFYDTLCCTCGDENYQKRFQVAPLEGQVALITGARVKIGFQAGLMLLRSGARVIVTTRFPLDAAERYAREPDFTRWGHRLQIHGLDLRHAPSVELFARHIADTHERLDILINNAAQTVRRPPGFYAHLLPGELRRPESLSEPVRRLLDGHLSCVARLSHGDGETAGHQAALASWANHDAAMGVHSSAALSQVPYAMEEDVGVQALFPTGAMDADLQQVDLRQVNSWRLTLSEVATAEMLEVHLVNAVAPFILCGKLKGLMLKHRDGPGHIVNVSAMEGSFSRGTKTDKHPHTNMAKAALNMMTLTSAPDYAKSQLYMNAVDTGWVTDEDPVQHATRKQNDYDFQPPLDIVDGAARVVDPVFNAYRTGELTFGRFYKDYRTTNW